VKEKTATFLKENSRMHATGPTMLNNENPRDMKCIRDVTVNNEFNDTALPVDENDLVSSLCPGRFQVKVYAYGSK
jgi:hypothetical protein